MTQQVSVPRTGATQAPERTASTRPPISSLIVYTLSTLLIVAAVTVAAVVVSRDDAPATNQNEYGAETAASYAALVQAYENAHNREQQSVTALDPTRDLAATFGASGTATVDGSFQANETTRMRSLAPAPDASSQVAETNRLLALAPDISFRIAEGNRMQALAPDTDDSFQVAETGRMQALGDKSSPNHPSNVR